MGFRLTPIFIKSEEIMSDEEILTIVGLSNLEKNQVVDFYQTSKQYERTFMGAKGNCKILVNGELAYKTFEDETPFLYIDNTEIASIIWDETSGVFGFSLIQNGKTVRKILVMAGEIECEEGEAISEELEIQDEEIFMPEEKAEIIETEGEEVFNEMLKAEKICRVTNILAKRYIGTGLVEIQEKIELNEYK
jgi:hypothetical protein